MDKIFQKEDLKAEREQVKAGKRDDDKAPHEDGLAQQGAPLSRHLTKKTRAKAAHRLGHGAAKVDSKMKLMKDSLSSTDPVRTVHCRSRVTSLMCFRWSCESPSLT